MRIVTNGREVGKKYRKTLASRRPLKQKRGILCRVMFTHQKEKKREIPHSSKETIILGRRSKVEPLRHVSTTTSTGNLRFPSVYYFFFFVYIRGVGGGRESPIRCGRTMYGIICCTGYGAQPFFHVSYFCSFLNFCDILVSCLSINLIIEHLHSVPCCLRSYGESVEE